MEEFVDEVDGEATQRAIGVYQIVCLSRQLGEAGDLTHRDRVSDTVELGEVDDLVEGVCYGQSETDVSVGRMEPRLSPGVWLVEAMHATHSGSATLPVPPLLARDKRLVLARHGAGRFEGRTFQAARRAKRTTASLSCGLLGAGRRRSRERGRVGRRRAATARERCRVYGCFLHVKGVRARLHVDSRYPSGHAHTNAAFNGPQTGVPIEHRPAIREVRSAALTRLV
jgi:hypothetical protein